MIKVYIVNDEWDNPKNEKSEELLCKWIDLPITEDVLAEELEEIEVKFGEDGVPTFEDLWMEKGWHIEDFETDYDPVIDEDLAEHKNNLWELNNLAEDLESITDFDEDMIVAAMDATGYSLDYTLSNRNNIVFYRGMSLANVAEQLVDEGCFGNISGTSLAAYIDYEALGRDLRMDGYIETDKGVVYMG